MTFLYKIIFKALAVWDTLYMKAYINVCKARGMKIGNGVKISSHVDFGPDPFLIEIGDHTQIAEATRFVNHSETLKTLNRIGLDKTSIPGKIKIGKNCSIGYNCVILQNIQIGDNCILTTGSVLIHSMPSNSVFSGNPAKLICSVHEYIETTLEKTKTP